MFVILTIGWYLIRYTYARRSRHEKVHGPPRSKGSALLLISLTGLGILPLIFVATGFPQFATYTFHPIQGWLGLLFRSRPLDVPVTHKTLGGFVVSLDVRRAIDW